MSDTLVIPFTYNEKTQQATLNTDDVFRCLALAHALHDTNQSSSWATLDRDWARFYPDMHPCGVPGSSQFIVTARPGAERSVAEMLAAVVPSSEGMRCGLIYPSSGERTYSVQFYANGLCLIVNTANPRDLEIVKHGLPPEMQEEHEVTDYFWSSVNQELTDPFLSSEPEWGSEDIEYAQGFTQSQFVELLQLCLISEPNISAYAGETLVIEASDGEYSAGIADHSGVKSERLEALVDALCSVFEPEGWNCSYNDGSTVRESGYSEGALHLRVDVDDEIVSANPRDRMKAYHELAQWFTEHELDVNACSPAEAVTA